MFKQTLCLIELNQNTLSDKNGHIYTHVVVRGGQIPGDGTTLPPAAVGETTNPNHRSEKKRSDVRRFFCHVTTTSTRPTTPKWWFFQALIARPIAGSVQDRLEQDRLKKLETLSLR